MFYVLLFYNSTAIHINYLLSGDWDLSERSDLDRFPFFFFRRDFDRDLLLRRWWWWWSFLFFFFFLEWLSGEDLKCNFGLVAYTSFLRTLLLKEKWNCHVAIKTQCCQLFSYTFLRKMPILCGRIPIFQKNDSLKFLRSCTV